MILGRGKSESSLRLKQNKNDAMSRYPMASPH